MWLLGMDLWKYAIYVKTGDLVLTIDHISKNPHQIQHKI